MASTEYLRVTDLHAFYGESHILHGMDFRVNSGECVTLLGRNGAGRTTTLKAMAIALLIIGLLAGTLNLQKILDLQAAGGVLSWFIWTQPLAWLIFFTSAMASCRSSFEAEETRT